MTAIRHRVSCLLVLPITCLALAAQETGWRKPPKPILDCLSAPPPPSTSVSPDRTHMMLSFRESMPSLAVQARPILRLAGIRLDPATRGRQRGARATGFTLVSLETGKQQPVEVPKDCDLGGPIWTTDGRRFAFTNTTDTGIELWVADVESAKSRRVDGVQLNGVLGSSVSWMPDQKKLLCKLVATPQEPPARISPPLGPNVQQSDGRKAPVRTYQDLLKDSHDQLLFSHFAHSSLAVVDPATGRIETIGDPAMYTSARPSPDGSHFLVTTIIPPFSLLVTYRSFPHRIAVLDSRGRESYRVADLPLAESVPIGGVLEGPRRVQWIPTEPHTLVWAEALDGGDPKTEATHRDRLMIHDPLVRMPPREWHRLQHRYRGASFGSDAMVLVSEYDRDTRWSRTWLTHPRDRDREPSLLFERSTQDAYGDPGRPLTRRLDNGFSVVRDDNEQLFFTGSGASPKGDRPFLDCWKLDPSKTTTLEKERLFHCGENVYEAVVALLSDDGNQLLIRRESKKEFPNFFILNQATGKERAITKLEDPVAKYTQKISKKLVTYERNDGIPLSATLYLPPDYEEGQRLPVLVWAYPREFNSRKNAGQVRGSQHRYTRMSGTSPLLLTLHGYAVMNNAAMPIVGPVETANDTFIDQLVAGAKAAIDAAVAEGVADRNRAAIAGHSYGAFMTANLLAHCDLFRAGIARSGAYNRTLTPFGFQNERRTFWEAPEIYFAMSPFMHAPEIDEPLLLIHGEADNNSGTFPIQSKRLYHAIKGHGGTARLVMLPHESHGYRARESVLHCMAETVEWLDRYVKNAPVRASDAKDAAGGRDPR